MGRILRSLVLLGVVLSAAADFTENCPQGCTCYWSLGKKEADCTLDKLQELPRTLSSEIQSLYLTGNNLTEIKNHAFVNVPLVNLLALTLRDCKLLTIHKNGLSGLTSLIDLDLSRNQLKTLHPDTFKELVNIRSIDLNNNLLEKLDDGLFNNLPSLRTVELIHNRITQVGEKTFLNVPNLNIIRLNSNKLEHMNVNILSSLDLLHVHIYVHDNPWRCDCNLRAFIDLVIDKRLLIEPTKCTEPAKLQGKLWNELNSTDLDCPSSTVNPNASTTLPSSDTNVNLFGQVNSKILPVVDWVLNAQVADGTHRYQGELKYYITQSKDENSRRVNVTVLHEETSPNGE